MRTPVIYYGGKQSLADIILPLLPPHHLYCEPFAGGAAVFFAKTPSTEEILNDLNIELVNFWEVLKNDFDGLANEVSASLHSRKLHNQAKVIYENPDMFDRVKRAWAVWYLLTTGFGARLDTGWAHDVHGKRLSMFRHRVIDFTFELSKRVKNTRIENCDAVKIIKNNDMPDALFYIDPPYVGADQGHYAGYTQQAFDNLLETLTRVKGKFLLSSYPNKRLSWYVVNNGWFQFEVKMNNPMSASGKGHKIEKTEVLTANYPIYKNQTPELFD